ncbi:MAG TPA: hypothetical protein PLP21_05780 [Pyrinomonadaceae bacterium]|nr:hypothetical protein [Acidobacteriota bacterium]HQZ95807.1 hypothetical protein [Pyrinomonadaceae bacterium]
MTYSDISDITNLVDAFENATISREAWGHAEHMIVALHYLGLHDPETATEKMRQGILNLLVNGFGVDLAKEMPYHETLTIFWMRTVAEFMMARTDSSTIDIAKELVVNFDKDYPLKFYSRELLFSDRAMAAFVEADLA